MEPSEARPGSLPYLADLSLGSFRNFSSLSIKPCPGLNFFLGPNGAGKTSILESIHVLASGRSFRRSPPRDMVCRGSTAFHISGRLKRGNIVDQLGIGWDHGSWTARLNGEKVTRISQLANLLPLAVIEPDSGLLLTDGPDSRRRFFDKLVFHVKHGYGGLLGEYRRALAQRNAGLRIGKDRSTMSVYEQLMADLANEIERERVGVFDVFQSNLRVCIEALTGGDVTVDAAYLPGWDTQQDLAQVLFQERTTDIEIGYTRHGPHRHDLRMSWDGKLVRKSFSRGELKAVVVAMIMAQVLTTQSLTDKRCVIILDDLFSELDQDRSGRVLGFFESLDTQLFLSGVEPHRCLGDWQSENKLFHVKHGTVEEAEG